MDVRTRVEGDLEVIRRGTVDILTVEDLARKLEAHHRGERPPLRVKLGLDPTSPDLHLGHSIVLRKCRQFQELGHKVVLIIGDATSAVGDPSGRSKTRPVLSREQIEANCRTYFEQAGKILRLDDEVLEIRYNGEWFRSMSFEEIVGLMSRMTVARLLERDDFSKRYKAGVPIALHELFYPIMQGYDSVMVRSDVELGGTDQTFNLLVGRSFQPDFGQEAQVAITMPLLVGLDGKQKMSKSLGNHIAVVDAPRDMFGKVMSLPDELMRSYYELLTDVPMDEVERILAGHPMEAKKRLAVEITAFYYDRATAEREREEFERAFSRRELPTEIPEYEAPPAGEDGRRALLELVLATGGFSSRKEARRLIMQGGVKVNGEAVKDPAARIELSPETVLKIGKKRFARFRAE